MRSTGVVRVSGIQVQHWNEWSEGHRRAKQGHNLHTDEFFVVAGEALPGIALTSGAAAGQTGWVTSTSYEKHAIAD